MYNHFCIYNLQKGWMGNLQENVVQFLKVLHHWRERIGTEEPLKKKGSGQYNKLSIRALRRSHGIVEVDQKNTSLQKN